MVSHSRLYCYSRVSLKSRLENVSVRVEAVAIHWGDDLLDTTQGLDVLGVRGIDQAVELTLVNGITTISQRARFLSILPWSIGEFLVEHASEGFDWDSLMVYLRRIEFVTLAATRLDNEIHEADAGGALGAYLHQDLLRKLLDNEPVSYPDDRGGAMLGVYLGPCRAIGLLIDGDEAVPYRLSPRGREIWQIRKERLQGSPVTATVSEGTFLTRELAETAIPDFSLASLSRSGEEVRLLHSALVSPWDPGNEPERARVTKAYEGINGTIAWANTLLSSEPDSSANLLVRNFENCIEGRSEDRIAFTWAEYEYRRRCHFALELLLAALTTSLTEFEEASITQIASEWFGSFEASPLLSNVWPSASEAWGSTALQGVASVPERLFASDRLPTSDLRHVASSDQVLFAIAILTATASQTRSIRRDGHLDHKPTSPGERAVDIIETAGEEPFSELVERLVELAALAHLQTTLRKMGAGQKCSLRFFPDGPLLRSTGIGMSPGHSTDRLTNVLRILTDVGKLRRDDGKFAPFGGGEQ